MLHARAGVTDVDHTEIPSATYKASHQRPAGRRRADDGRHQPATEEVFAVCPRASKAQLDQAVAAAKAAFPRLEQHPDRPRARQR